MLCADKRPMCIVRVYLMPQFAYENTTFPTLTPRRSSSRFSCRLKIALFRKTSQSLVVTPGQLKSHSSTQSNQGLLFPSLQCSNSDSRSTQAPPKLCESKSTLQVVCFKARSTNSNLFAQTSQSQSLPSAQSKLLQHFVPIQVVCPKTPNESKPNPLPSPRTPGSQFIDQL